MKLDEVISKISESLAKGEFITFFCHCTISYSGRAESYLGFGDRIIIIKQDKTVLIHQPEGGMPINYLRPPASFNFTLQKTLNEENNIPYLLFESRSKDDEIVVQIVRVYDLFSKRLTDGKKQELSGNEAEMSDMIKNNPKVISDDFIPLSREEHTKYGFIDVFGHMGNGVLAIVECKRYTAGLSAVTQLRRYVEKMKSLKGIDNVTGIIAAPSITANALEMLTDWGFSFSQVDPPKRHIKKRKSQKKINSFF